MKTVRQTQTGFTLVEMLVVIAGIGLLIILLLPAVQQAREAARRIHCSNNLKQLGLAFHSYHDVHQSFPPGSLGCCQGTWQVSVLPFIEASTLSDLYSVDKTFLYSDAENLPVTTTRIAALTCPSDEPNAPVSSITSHNYAVNFGNTGFQQQPALNGVAFGGAPFSVVPAWSTARDLTMSLADVTDGTSNTLLAGEVLQGKQHDLRGFTWWSEATQFTTYLPPNTSQPDRMGESCVSLPGANLPCAAATDSYPTMYASRSQHPGGVQSAVCDGSARFISDMVTLAAWRAPSTTKGGEGLAEF